MKLVIVCVSQVTARRLIGGKWGLNNGQACVSADHIITTKDFAPKLVRLPVNFLLPIYVYLKYADLIGIGFLLMEVIQQIDALKLELEQFFGKDPLISEDLSRIVSSNHFARLSKLLDEDKVSGKIVHGGGRNKDDL